MCVEVLRSCLALTSRSRASDSQHIGLFARATRTCFIISAATVLMALMTPGQARAQFIVCNQTLDVVNLAAGQEVDNSFQTEGWWTIGANQCVNVVREELANRYIYVYATDVFGQSVLSGSVEMCIERRRFSIRGIDECWERGHVAARFYEVDTLEQPRWTFFLTGRGP